MLPLSKDFFGPMILFAGVVRTVSTIMVAALGEEVALHAGLAFQLVADSLLVPETVLLDQRLGIELRMLLG